MARRWCVREMRPRRYPPIVRPPSSQQQREGVDLVSICSLRLSRRFLLELAAAGLITGMSATSPLAALAQASGGAPLKIATIGSGREGGALGTLFAKAGHPVMFSSRHPEQLKELVVSAGPNAQAGTVEQAVAFADVVLLVVPYTAVEGIGKEFGKALAAKKLVIDV